MGRAIGQRKAGGGKDELNEQQLEAKWRSVSFPLFVEGHQKRHFRTNVLWYVCVCVRGCVPFILLSYVNQHTHTYVRTNQRELHAAQLVIILFAHQLQLHTHTHTHTQSLSHICMHAWEERPLVKCGVLIRAATQASLEVLDAILLRLLVQSLVFTQVCVFVRVRVRLCVCVCVSNGSSFSS